jgi:hypothetical protein
MTPARVWIILGILLMIGAPVIFGLTLRATSDAARAAGLTGVYLLAIGALGLTGKLLQALQGRWAARLTERLDQQVMGSFSSFQTRYLRFVAERNRSIEVKGLSAQGLYTLELDKVFVDPRLTPEIDRLAALDPLRLPPSDGSADRRTLWAVMETPGLAGLVILGRPGSGKTTLLRHTALRLASGQASEGWPRWLPLLFNLRDLAGAVQKNPSLSLAQVAGAGLALWGLTVPLRWFDERLAKGACLVMLDGLDEVADPLARSQVTAWVQRQMRRYPANRFILTSRPSGYQAPDLAGFTVMELAPFDRQQIWTFVQNWYLAGEIMAGQRDDLGVRGEAQRQANDLITRLQGSTDLLELAASPLLLTMIASVHRFKRALPARRVDLYKELCEVFLSQPGAARGQAMELSPAQKQHVLQHLAYYLMTRQAREARRDDVVRTIGEPLKRLGQVVSAETVLQDIERETGLLQELRPGWYGFVHLTLQEYLAAVQAVELNLDAELAGRIKNEWWHATIRLYCAQTDASTILSACLREAPVSLPVLILAIECAEEAPVLSDRVRGQLDEALSRYAEDPDELRRCIVAEALLALRLRRMERIAEGYYAANSLLTCAEYQLFLDDLGETAIQRAPDHWPAAHYPDGTARQPVLGVRMEDAQAYCAWLTERLRGEWEIRLPVGLFTYNRSGRLERSDLLPPLGGTAGYWFQLLPETRPRKEAGLLVFNRAALESFEGGNILPAFMESGEARPGTDFEARFVQQVTGDLARALPASRRLVEALGQAREAARALQRYLADELPDGHAGLAAQAGASEDRLALDLITASGFVKDLVKALELAAEAGPQVSALLLGYVERAQEATTRVEGDRPQRAAEIARLAADLDELGQGLAERADDPDRQWAGKLGLHLERERILENALETALHLQAGGELPPDLAQPLREHLEKAEANPRPLYASLAAYLLKAFNLREPAFVDIALARRSEAGGASAASKTAEMTNYDDPALIRDFHYARQIAIARKPVSPDGKRPPSFSLDDPQAREFLRWYIRLNSLGLAFRWLWAMPAAPAGWRARRTPEGQHALEKRQKCQEMVRFYLARYCDFAVTEWRIRGEVHPVEGIRLVKERR